MLRTFFKNDLSQVLAIEQSVHVAPWSQETFQICLHSNCESWVVEQDKKIIGFIFISIQAEECHVLNLCIAHRHQGQGFGKMLLQHALTHAKQKGAKVIYLEVRRSNSRAISLYRALQFELIGERRDYYPTVAGHEDALIFAKNLQHDVLF